MFLAMLLTDKKKVAGMGKNKIKERPVKQSFDFRKKL